MSASRFEALHAAITQRFQTGFVTADMVPVAFLPCQFDGHSFTSPTEATWCRLVIVDGQRINAAVGIAFQRHVGSVYLQIFIPKNSGSRPARLAGDKFAAIFDNADFGPAGLQIIFRSVSLMRIGLTQEGFFQWNAVGDFWADVTA